ANPDDEQSLLELAWSLRTSGDKESAGKLYRYLLRVYAERRDWRSLNSLGDTLRRLVGNLDDAEDALRQSLDIKPDNFDAWKNFCYLMCSRRDPAAAQQTVRRFIQTCPDHPRQAEAWVCLGTALGSFDDFGPTLFLATRMQAFSAAHACLVTMAYGEAILAVGAVLNMLSSATSFQPVDPVAFNIAWVAPSTLL